MSCRSSTGRLRRCQKWVGAGHSRWRRRVRVKAPEAPTPAFGCCEREPAQIPPRVTAHSYWDPVPLPERGRPPRAAYRAALDQLTADDLARQCAARHVMYDHVRGIWERANERAVLVPAWGQVQVTTVRPAAGGPTRRVLVNGYGRTDDDAAEQHAAVTARVAASSSG